MGFLKNLGALFTGAPAAAGKGLPETLRLLFDRRSCRSFTGEPLAAPDLQAILEAGRFAPSTVNLQTWTFITFSQEQWKAAFARPIPFKGACAILICADLYRIKQHLPEFQETPYVNLSLALFNAGLAAMSMTMAAESLGIRSIMLSDTGRAGLLDGAYLQEKLGLPDAVLPVTTLVLGRGGLQLPGIPPRQPRDAVVMPGNYDSSAGSRLDDWYDQMFIGYKITHPLSNFDRQIEYYRKKMIEAEGWVRAVFTNRLPTGETQDGRRGHSRHVRAE
jgi:nitroreductase